MRSSPLVLSAALLWLTACPGGGGDTETSTTSASSTTVNETSETGETKPTTGTTGAEVACGERLPPEGSACAVEGEVCAFEDDPCASYVGAECQAGVWVHYTNTPGVDCGAVKCEPPNLPAEGSPCSEEGEYCSGDCSDQCSFCNVLRCEGGTWQGLEVFPANCLGCEELCDLVAPAMCPGGPPDTASCVSGCEDNKVGRCKAQFSDVRACAAEKQVFTCDMEGRPVAEGCEAQFEAFYACLMP
jgi:hypothetical protein